jgi:hypothetical protein
MTKIKALLLSSGVSLALAGAAGWACYQWGVSVGVSDEREIQARAVQAWQQRTHGAMVALEAARAERRDDLRETVEVIRYVDDPTGCADERVPADILDRLRGPGSGAR